MPATSAEPARTARHSAHLPDGTLVAITGGKAVSRCRRHLEHARHAPARSTATWFWCTAAAPGVEKIAASWAEARGVNQVVCRPDWNAHGKAAPFRRNDELLNLLPKGVIAFPGSSGITGNLDRQGEALGHSRDGRYAESDRLPRKKQRSVPHGTGRFLRFHDGLSGCVAVLCAGHIGMRTRKPLCVRSGRRVPPRFAQAALTL